MGCASERPIHPLRLEGFPGATIEPDLFQLRDGRRWVFRDRLAPDGPLLVLELRKAGEAWRLVGASGAETPVPGWTGKLQGEVGTSWRAAGALCTAFGYDRVAVLGAERRALVVAVERRPRRDLYWFVKEMGWVRIRIERDGRVVSDALLEQYSPGTAN